MTLSTLCYAIVLAGRKSALRPGCRPETDFRPGSTQGTNSSLWVPCLIFLAWRGLALHHIRFEIQDFRPDPSKFSGPSELSHLQSTVLLVPWGDRQRPPPPPSPSLGGSDPSPTPRQTCFCPPRGTMRITNILKFRKHCVRRGSGGRDCAIKV